MPLIYADASVLFAYFHPTDEFSDLVDAAVRRDAPDFVYWPWLRYELRHNLRRFKSGKHGAAAWRALRAAENTQARLRWQTDLTASRMLEAAEELSGERAAENGAGAVDFVHVAAARRLKLVTGLDGFWTCDGEQALLASAAGLETRRFELEHPPGQLPA